MAAPIEFILNQVQVDFICSKMPKGYSLLQANLFKQREQRVLKKVNKYDASFSNTKQESQDSKNKRIQRFGANSKETIKGSPSNENIRKGLSNLQKLKAHILYPKLQSSLNLDKIETQFKLDGNLMSLQNQISNGLQKLKKAITSQEQKEQINQFEQQFQIIFRINQPLTTQSQKQPQSNKKQDQQISYEEKKILSSQIRSLSQEYLSGVWEIVQQSISTKEEEELEFDIDQLPVKVIRRLQEYVSSKQNNKKVKLEPSIPFSSSKSQIREEDSSFPSESSD